MCPLCTALVDFDFGHSWGLHETLLVWSPFFRWSSSIVTYNIRVMLNLFRWVSQPPLRKHVCCACTWYPYRNCLFNRFGGTAAAHLPGPDLWPLHLLFKTYYFSMLLKAQDHQISSQRELADELSAFFEQLNSLLFHGNPRCPGITSLRICTVTVAKGLYATVTPSNVFREP